MDEIEDKFVKLLAEKGLGVNAVQLRQFALYYEQLLIWNKKMNLTNIVEKEQVYIKHFYDSLALSFYLRLNDFHSMVDIGSGAGFPSIPLKIMFPHLKVSIVDSLNKRIQFLKFLVNELALEQIDCIHSRAETLAREDAYRDQYDIAVARAVAKLNVLNELCLPYVCRNGLFIAMKGTDPTEELKEAKHSLQQLKSSAENVYRFTLPIENAERHLIFIRKLAVTPAKYPRMSGDIVKRPL